MMMVSDSLPAPEPMPVASPDVTDPTPLWLKITVSPETGTEPVLQLAAVAHDEAELAIQ
jgi:hypothetical protein